MLAIAEPRAKSKAEYFFRPYGTDLPFTSFPSIRQLPDTGLLSLSPSGTKVLTIQS
jgi:hypothetical protein